MPQNPYLTPPKPVGPAIGAIQSSFAATPKPAPVAPAPLTPQQTQNRANRVARRQARSAAAQPQPIPQPASDAMLSYQSAMKASQPMLAQQESQMKQSMAGAPAQPAGGFNPNAMVNATGAARGAAMEKMARPGAVRRGFAQAQATGAVPGMPPKPPTY